MKHKIPCQHCKERYVGCHGECSSYLLYRKERDELLELKHQAEKKIADVQGYKYHETHRMIKRKCLKKIMK